MEPDKSTQRAQDLLTCLLCSQYFDDPRLLPCGHTFCRKCLERCVASVNESRLRSPSVDRCRRTLLPCPAAPVCLHVAIVPEQGIVGFPVDTRIARIKDRVVTEMADNISRRIRNNGGSSDTCSTQSDQTDLSDFSTETSFSAPAAATDHYTSPQSSNSRYPNLAKYAKYFDTSSTPTSATSAAAAADDDDGGPGESAVFTGRTSRTDRRRVGYSSSFQHRRRRVNVSSPTTTGTDNQRDFVRHHQSSRCESAPHLDTAPTARHRPTSLILEEFFLNEDTTQPSRRALSSDRSQRHRSELRDQPLPTHRENVATTATPTVGATTSSPVTNASGQVTTSGTEYSQDRSAQQHDTVNSSRVSRRRLPDPPTDTTNQQQQQQQRRPHSAAIVGCNRDSELYNNSNNMSATSVKQAINCVSTPQQSVTPSTSASPANTLQHNSKECDISASQSATALHYNSRESTTTQNSNKNVDKLNVSSADSHNVRTNTAASSETATGKSTSTPAAGPSMTCGGNTAGRSPVIVSNSVETTKQQTQHRNVTTSSSCPTVPTAGCNTVTGTPTGTTGTIAAATIGPNTANNQQTSTVHSPTVECQSPDNKKPVSHTMTSSHSSPSNCNTCPIVQPCQTDTLPDDNKSSPDVTDSGNDKESTFAKFDDIMRAARLKYSTVDNTQSSNNKSCKAAVYADTLLPRWRLQRDNFAIPTCLAISSTGLTFVTDVANSSLDLLDEDGNLSHSVTGMKPFSVTIDNNDRLYVADRRSRTVRVFDIYGSDIAQWDSETTSFGWISGIASLHNGNLAIVDRERCKVGIYTVNGERLTEFGAYGVNEHQLCMADFVAVDSHDRILVADSGNHCLKVFDSSSGKLISRYSNRGVDDGSLLWPKGVTVNASDCIIVADTNNDRISQFSVDGQFMCHLVTDVVKPFHVNCGGEQLLGYTQFTLSGTSQIDVYSTDQQ